MSYIKRYLEDSILSASKSYPVVLVTGARQIGKTTLLKHLCEKERKYVTLDDLALREMANKDPKLFLKQFSPPVLIDEIQYAPNLFPYIKMIVDEKKESGAFWITGSQQFQLMKNVTESLAGRVAIANLAGFSFAEKKNYDLKKESFLNNRIDFGQQSEVIELDEIYRSIFEGGSPFIATNPEADVQLFFNNYLQTYLQRDVRDLMNVGDIIVFTTFLKSCAARTSQLLNISDLCKDTGVSHSTAKSWLSILEASGIIFLLQPWHSNINKRIVKTPKLYFIDTGLCAFLTGWSSSETLMNGAMSGAIFENWVIVEILKSWWFRMKIPPVYFYRDKDGREIDLIIKTDGTAYPVEIKKSATISSDWNKHFTVLEKFDIKRGNGLVISLADDYVMISENDTVVPAWWIN